jgi:hypothetical protein
VHHLPGDNACMHEKPKRKEKEKEKEKENTG